MSSEAKVEFQTNSNKELRHLLQDDYLKTYEENVMPGSLEDNIPYFLPEGRVQLLEAALLLL